MLAQQVQQINSNELAELVADHEALTRRVQLLQKFDPTYQGPNGFDFDFNQWVANLDEPEINEDQYLYAQATMSGVPAF